MRRVFGVVMLALASSLVAQDAYERAAANVQRWRGLVRAFAPDVHWLPQGGGVVFAQNDGDRQRWVRVTTAGARSEKASLEDLGVAAGRAVLPPQRRVTASGASGTRTKVTFVNTTERAVRLFWVDGSRRQRAYGEVPAGDRRELSTFVGHVWLADFAPDDLAGIFVAELLPGTAAIDAGSIEAAGLRAQARASRGAFVRDDDVWLRGGGEHPVRLSTDGSAEDGFVEPLRWSPDGSAAMAFRRRPGERRQITLVEAAPRDQVQPRLHEFSYAKPGDRIDNVRPWIVDVAGEQLIAVAPEPFTNAWSVDRVHWSPRGDEVYCLYNQRGHQVLRVLGIDVATGAVRTVLEERSATFVDYSQKTFLHWLEGKDEFLWASERDGSNHLYHVDARSGAMRQVTKGKWLVREVERVDEQAQQIWFTALGVHPEQDPYHRHLARIDFDGEGLTLLTAADGTHEWQFSPDRSLVIDRWSRVDQPWVTELRRTADGSLVAELGRDDAAPLLAAGFRAPSRFVAKGRDGETDIHGILILPSNFDPAARYPVIEDIYAGPHGHFVPKQWGLSERQRRLAELGFVVVQIDGMGTNWRSRAFHDVCWRNLADSGLPDRIAWMRAAATQFPQLDLDHVGIFGGSAGGQSALAALLHHADFYKAAVADCGCHDNRMDKIWWNEAWMGYPVGDWYAANSNVTHAAKLSGKLLLTVGELDRNVDPASTMQVADALIRAGKDFDLVVVPGGGHGVGETSYLVRRRQEFFVRWLQSR